MTDAHKDTILDNPQLGQSHRPSGDWWECMVCGLLIGNRAEMVFSGTPAERYIFAVAHDNPLAVGALDQHEGSVEQSPCARTLERIYRHLLDAAGILRYLSNDDGSMLWRGGRSADLTRVPRDLITGAYAGFVLLASGRWAPASYHDGDDYAVRLEYQLRPGGCDHVEPARVDVPPPALFRFDGAWQLPGDKGLHDDGPAPTQLRVGTDAGGSGWYLHGKPIEAGHSLDVYLPGAGWTGARMETIGRPHMVAGNSRPARIPKANLHVALAGGSEVAIPAVGLDVRLPGAVG